MESEDDMDNRLSHPDVCRCCLSSNGARDVTSTYINDAGTNEIYSEMLQECFGISLSYLVEWGPSRKVCQLCIEHLRDAQRFKQQVLQAEEQFEAYYRDKTDAVIREVPLKTEMNMKTDDFDENGDDTEYLDEEFLQEKESINAESFALDNNSLTELPLKRKRGRPRKNSGAPPKPKTSNVLKKNKRKLSEVTDDSDSDIPISGLKKDAISGGEDKGEIGIKGESSAGIKKRSRGHTAIPNKVKQVSERKRVMLTCETVLRYTTACPFRHHKSWFQCFFCQQDFMEVNLLRHHTLNDHSNIEEEIKKIKRYPRSLQIEISNLKCHICNLTLTDVTAMCLHFVDCHDKVIYKECIADYKVDASPYSCHICDKQFHVFRSLTTHLNEHYAYCICDVCGKSFLNSKRLKVHKRTHEKGNFPCAECGKVLKTKTSKANHIESVHSKRVIKCQICFKPMKHYNYRIKHMSEVHNITHKFKCVICGREYNIKHYLATHIRQTHGNKNKKCTECNSTFITNHGLKKHMLKHTGAKPYSCHVCSKSYARSYTLREHMRTHESDRRYAGEMRVE